MKIEQITLVIALISLCSIASLPVKAGASTDLFEQHIIGWIENIEIHPENISLSAKIDTGADHSSLNVTNPTEFLKDDKKWIRFSIPLKEAKAVTIERPILRFARIKRKGTPSQKRPVVLLDICLGTLYKKDVPVNLTDRTRFKYPMLIGRSFLKGSAIVDSSLTFSQTPSCMVQ